MFVELIVAAACASSVGSYREACSKTTEATYVYIGADQFEGKVQAAVTQKAKTFVGKDVWGVGALAATAVKTARDKSITYKVKTNKKTAIIGTDFITPQIMFKDNNKGVGMGFGWSW